MLMINRKAMEDACKVFHDGDPFPHAIIDEFFDPAFARSLEREFPSFDSAVWHLYNNAIEIKKVCNDWNSFTERT